MTDDEYWEILCSPGVDTVVVQLRTAKSPLGGGITLAEKSIVPDESNSSVKWTEERLRKKIHRAKAEILHHRDYEAMMRRVAAEEGADG